MMMYAEVIDTKLSTMLSMRFLTQSLGLGVAPLAEPTADERGSEVYTAASRPLYHNDAREGWQTLRYQWQAEVDPSPTTPAE